METDLLVAAPACCRQHPSAGLASHSHQHPPPPHPTPPRTPGPSHAAPPVRVLAVGRKESAESFQRPRRRRKDLRSSLCFSFSRCACKDGRQWRSKFRQIEESSASDITLEESCSSALLSRLDKAHQLAWIATTTLAGTDLNSCNTLAAMSCAISPASSSWRSRRAARRAPCP